MPDPAAPPYGSPVAVKQDSDNRLASCYNCKRSKLKCVREGGNDPTCTRCRQRRVDCAAPAYHVGRHKGVKNKHTGIEKAVHQIEQAIKRNGRSSDEPQDRAELRRLLDRSRDLLNSDPASRRARDSQEGPSPQHTIASQDTPPSFVGSSSRDGGRAHSTEDEKLNLDDAENPLQLLARTSELLSTIDPHVTGSAEGRSAARLGPHRENDLQRFFGGFNPRLDVGDELDPIELGLMTLAEAEALFTYFFNRLAHTRWGIDPTIHTVEFVRSRSAFLLTSIAAASALFSPSLEALHKRLSSHRQKLANLVISSRYKSVEIVLAFMVNIPWISAGEHWADDETSTYISMALTIALDLSLNKAIQSAHDDARPQIENLASSECISARKALFTDGFSNIDPKSLLGQRLLRRRERTWLSLFVLERGVCLARGRDYILPLSPLIESCDQWHISDLADRWDGSIVSVAVLRRDLANLIARIRSICDGYNDGVTSEAAIVDMLKNEITMFFDRWYNTWPLQIGDREQLALPPYVEILASHTRLSMYSSVVNHSTAPIAARHYFRAAGLSSALNVLRVAVQGEAQLKTMPNNTAIMISFAACFALRVSAAADGQGSSLAPSIRTLILETTDALERIGSTPVQRKGLSVLFAEQLRRILKQVAKGTETSRQGQVPGSATEPVQRKPFANVNVPDHRSAAPQAPPQPQLQHHPEMMSMNPGAMTTDYMAFSTMSNDQLNAAIQNTDVGLDSLWEDFQFSNGTDLEWMDWSTV